MNTRDELDDFFERVPGHVLTVVDQAYFEYIDRPDYPDAVERVLQSGAAWSCCGRSRRSTGSRAPGSATRSPRRTSAARWRRCAARSTSTTGAGRGAREPRCDDEIARRRAERGGPRPARVCPAAHGLDPVPAVGNFLFVETGAAGAALFDRLLREGLSSGPLPASARRLRFASRSARRTRTTRWPRRSAAWSRPRDLRRARGVGTPSPPRGAARRRVPAALPGDPRLGSRQLAGADRAAGRRLRPHALGLVGRRAAGREHPAGDLHRASPRPARRPALAQGPDDRVRPRSARRLRGAAVRPRTEAIVALALVAGIGNAFFRPAVLAGLPNLVGDEELPVANALLQFVDWATTVVGPLAGGAIVALSGRLSPTGSTPSRSRSRPCSSRESRRGCSRATARSAAAAGGTFARGSTSCCTPAR